MQLVMFVRSWNHFTDIRCGFMFYFMKMVYSMQTNLKRCTFYHFLLYGLLVKSRSRVMLNASSHGRKTAEMKGEKTLK